MEQVLASNTDTHCVNAFRMEWHVFKHLCSKLEEEYGLKSPKNMKVIEKVGIFVYTMAHGTGYRNANERFQRSSSTISQIVHEVLVALVG